MDKKQQWLNSTAVFDWKDFNSLKPGIYGWYVVALAPKNMGEPKEKDNEWRQMYGFEKAWFNMDKDFYIADPHGHGSRKVTELVTHWDYMPRVPEL